MIGLGKVTTLPGPPSLLDCQGRAHLPKLDYVQGKPNSHPCGPKSSHSEERERRRKEH